MDRKTITLTHKARGVRVVVAESSIQADCRYSALTFALFREAARMLEEHPEMPREDQEAEMALRAMYSAIVCSLVESEGLPKPLTLAAFAELNVPASFLGRWFAVAQKLNPQWSRVASEEDPDEISEEEGTL